VMTAKYIAEYLGVELEIVQLDWDSLIPAVQAGVVDAVIAGQSMTAERMESVNFAGPYLYATIVCVTKNDSKYAEAKGKSELAGGICTSQSGTIWYDSCLPQIEGAQVQSPAESAPAMIMAAASGTVDFICTDMPTAQAAVIAYPELKILDFAGTEDDFEVSDEDINIGVSISKENTALCEAIDALLATKTAEDFNTLMAKAIEIQPLSE
ncbi:MAG: transporter substrate-binding domain-containing protein, partial [Parasporobacterium sp.]|nr:transporter substrate-binding domain-containing protein [Parasporobacterium sp.]